LLLQNHGVVLAAGSIEEVTMLSIMLEKACKAQLIRHGCWQLSVNSPGRSSGKTKDYL
jgi:hypothetical protein